MFKLHRAMSDVRTAIKENKDIDGNLEHVQDELSRLLDILDSVNEGNE